MKISNGQSRFNKAIGQASWNGDAVVAVQAMLLIVELHQQLATQDKVKTKLVVMALAPGSGLASGVGRWASAQHPHPRQTGCGLGNASVLGLKPIHPPGRPWRLGSQVTDKALA